MKQLTLTLAAIAAMISAKAQDVQTDLSNTSTSSSIGWGWIIVVIIIAIGLTLGGVWLYNRLRRNRNNGNQPANQRPTDHSNYIPGQQNQGGHQYNQPPQGYGGGNCSGNSTQRGVITNVYYGGPGAPAGTGSGNGGRGSNADNAQQPNDNQGDTYNLHYHFGSDARVETTTN